MIRCPAQASLREFEAARAKKVMESFLARKRPTVEIRKQVDLAYRISGQSVEIFEVRPAWKNLNRPGF